MTIAEMYDQRWSSWDPETPTTLDFFAQPDVRDNRDPEVFFAQIAKLATGMNVPLSQAVALLDQV